MAALQVGIAALFVKSGIINLNAGFDIAEYGSTNKRREEMRYLRLFLCCYMQVIFYLTVCFSLTCGCSK